MVFCLPGRTKIELRQKYSAARRIFNSLLGVSSGDETLRLMFDILHENTTLTWPTMSRIKYQLKQFWRAVMFNF